MPRIHYSVEFDTKIEAQARSHLKHLAQATRSHEMLIENSGCKTAAAGLRQ
jgi:hypothetical protein